MRAAAAYIITVISTSLHPPLSRKNRFKLQRKIAVSLAKSPAHCPQRDRRVIFIPDPHLVSHSLLAILDYGLAMEYNSNEIVHLEHIALTG